MKKTHILTKVQTLRQERNMLNYCDQLGGDTATITETKQLINNIQYNIYLLDELYEDNVLSAHQLIETTTQTKNDIHTQLTHALGSEKLATQYATRLRDFFKMERDMRQGHSPLIYSLHDFYLLKSCDIFLQRKLICHLLDNPAGYTPAVELFDQLGEIVDDMLDVDEDLDTYNSNRFLLSLFHGGVKQTKDEYRAFIAEKIAIITGAETQLHHLGLDLKDLKQQLARGLTRNYTTLLQKQSLTYTMIYH